jgi:hypothetical protein
VGADEERWIDERWVQGMPRIHTTDKHILISFHRNGLDDALYAIERLITLFQYDGPLSCREDSANRALTGKQPAAIGSNSEIGIMRSFSFIGIGFAGGMITSDEICSMNILLNLRDTHDRDSENDLHLFLG